MAKSYKESHSVTLSGILGIEDDIITVEVEELGTISLVDAIQQFKDKDVNIAIKIQEEKE